MISKTVATVFIFCTMALSVQANVFVFSSPGVPVPNLPGFRSFKLTAFSDVLEEPISVIDFRGLTNQNDPATALGIFGPLNQLTFGGNSTVFEDVFDIGSQFDEARAQDSHFLFNSLQDGIVVAGPQSEESTNHLRSVFGTGSETGFGQSVEFVQLVLPPRSQVHYRGVFSVPRGGTFVDLPAVHGVVVNSVPEFPESTLGFLAALGMIGLGSLPCRQRHVVVVDG